MSSIFAPQMTYSVGKAPLGVAVGDINGDGKPDVVCANAGEGSVSVLVNQCTFTPPFASAFATQASYSVGSAPYGVAVGDVNGDGKPDVVCTNAGDGSISVLINQGTFVPPFATAFAAQVTYGVGSQPVSIAVADVNGDGKPDVVCTNAGDGTVSVLVNQGTFSSPFATAFALQQIYNVSLGPREIAVADVNGDGKIDVVCANAGGNSVSVLANQGTFASPFATAFAAQVTYLVNSGPYGVAMGDVNGDGKLDVISANYVSGSGTTVSVLVNRGTFVSPFATAFAAQVNYSAGIAPVGVAVGDVSGDSKLDVVCVNFGEGTVSVLVNQGTFVSPFTTAFAAQVTYGVGNSPYGVAVADVNGDGKLDVITANDHWDSVSVLLNSVQVSDLTPASIPALLPGQMADLSSIQVPNLMAAQVPTLSLIQVPNLMPVQVPTLAPSQLPNLIPAVVPIATPSQIPSLLASQIDSLSPAQVPAVSRVQVPVLVLGRGGLPEQIPALSPAQVPALSTGQIGSLAPVQIPVAAPGQVPVMVLGRGGFPEQVPLLSPAQVPAVSPGQISSLSPAQLPLLPPNHLPPPVSLSPPPPPPRQCFANQFPAVFDVASINGINGLQISSTVRGFGSWVESAGDLNEDGKADIVIGTGNLGYLGSTYIIFGSSTFPALFNLTATTLTGINGLTINNGFGLGRGLGDINRDGKPDLLFGDRLDFKAQIVFGSNTLPASFDVNALNGNNGFTLLGNSGSDIDLGSSINGLGDINGDGMPDFIVGAFFGSAGSGKAYVVFGRSSGYPASLSTSSINGANGFLVTFDGLLYGVSGLGDVNMDGRPDLIISGASNSISGMAYVIFGSNVYPASINPTSLDGKNGFAIKHSTNVGYNVGASVSNIGDVNGDSVSDIILGQYNDIGDVPGKIHVIFGSNTFPASFDLATLNGSNGFTIVNGGMDLGRTASGGIDFNGDGVFDILIGSADLNKVYVIFGSTVFSALFDLNTLDGNNGFAARGGGIGFSASGLGDVNGDGRDDIIIGTQKANAAYIIYGRSADRIACSPPPPPVSPVAPAAPSTPSPLTPSAPSLLPSAPAVFVKRFAPMILMRTVGHREIRGTVQMLVNDAKKIAYLVIPGNGISILNITDPTDPVLASNMPVTGSASSIATLRHPDLLAMAGYSDEVTLVNISDTAHPIPVSNITIAGRISSITTFAQHPDLLAAAGSAGGFTLVNVADILRPAAISNIATGDDYRRAPLIATLAHPDLFAVSDSYNGITLVNIANASNPIPVNHITTAGRVSYLAEFAQRPNLLVIANEYIGLTFVNVTDVHNPIKVSTVITASSISYITLFTQYPDLLAAVDGTSISLINITDIYNPVLVTKVMMQGYAQFIGVLSYNSHPQYNDLLLSAGLQLGLTVTEINTEPVFQINNVTLTPSTQSNANAKSVVSLVQHPNLLAVANADNGVTLVAITDIDNPISSIATMGSALFVLELARPNLLAIAAGDGGITIVDITDIHNPVTVGNSPTADYAYSVAALSQHPDLLAVADGNAGLTIMNIANISHPVMGGNVKTRGNARFIVTLARHPNLLAVADGNAGLTIINITDIHNPTQVSNVKTKGNARFIATLAQYPNLLAIADEFAGISLINIADVFYPALVSMVPTTSLATASYPRSIATLEQYPDLLLVANDYAGIALIDITNIAHPVLVRNTPTTGYAQYITTTPDSNLLVAACGYSGIALVNTTSLALWTSYLPKQKVGYKISEKVFVYNNQFPLSELLVPSASTVRMRQIGEDGVTTKDAPQWLSIDTYSLTLNSAPPKEVTGQHFAIALTFEAPSTITRKVDSYSPLFRFDVVSSLVLDKTLANYTLNQTLIVLPTLAIDALAQLVTLTFTVSPSENIQFIIADDFGPIKPTFNKVTGVFEAFGAPRNLNVMLQYLRYIALKPYASTTTGINLQLEDAGLNYPTVDNLNMSFFRQNYAPVCLPGVIPINIEVNQNLDYTIPQDSCADIDDSIHGLELLYTIDSFSSSGTSRSDASSDDGSLTALPNWLIFVPDQRRFHGSAPAHTGMFFITVNVTDRYAIAQLNYQFSVVRLNNHPPRQIKSLDQLNVQTPGLFNPIPGPAQESNFAPSDYFIDDDGDDMIVSISNIPGWLTISPDNLTITADNSTGSFALSAVLGPSDTDLFNSRIGYMRVKVSDCVPQANSSNCTSFLIVDYQYIVTGESTLTLGLAYGSMILSALGIALGWYACRNRIYNTVAWGRYSYRPPQLGGAADAFHLFATVSDSPVDDCELPSVTCWSPAMQRFSDETGVHYFKHKVLERLDGKEKHAHEDIMATTVSLMRTLPAHTRSQKTKAKMLNSVPKAFNAIFGRLFSCWGIEMNRNHFAIFEPVVAGLPSWLKYNQETRMLRVVDIAQDDHVHLDTVIVIRFLNDKGRIMEEITFVVQDERLFTKIYLDTLEGCAINYPSIAADGLALSLTYPTMTFGTSGIRSAFGMPGPCDTWRPTPVSLLMQEDAGFGSGGAGFGGGGAGLGGGGAGLIVNGAGFVGPGTSLIMAIPEMRYDNPILNHKAITDIIKQAKAIGGSGLAATLIDICGANRALSAQIIRAFEDNGIEPTLHLIEDVRIASDRTSADGTTSDGMVAGSESALVQADELAHGDATALTPVSGALIPFGAIPVHDQAQQLPLALMAGAEQEAGAQFAVENLIRQIQPALYRASLVLKGADTAIDAIRWYQQPTQEHAQALAVDALHLYAMWAGYSVVSAATSAVLVAHAYNEAGFDAAAKQAAMAAAYMALPVLAFSASPAVGVGFTAAMTCYTAYQVGANGYMLYQENFGAESFGQERFGSDAMLDERLLVVGDRADGADEWMA